MAAGDPMDYERKRPVRNRLVRKMRQERTRWVGCWGQNVSGTVGWRRCEGLFWLMG